MAAGLSSFVGRRPRHHPQPFTQSPLPLAVAAELRRACKCKCAAVVIATKDAVLREVRFDFEQRREAKALLTTQAEVRALQEALQEAVRCSPPPTKAQVEEDPALSRWTLLGVRPAQNGPSYVASGLSTATTL